MGKELYPSSEHIMITADCGGSNSYRSRLWKLKLQEFASEIGKNIHVCHFPPGTSKWNKIEHRLFCHITTNWGGRPLTSLQVVINLIRNTTTTHGLEVEARLDENLYQTGIKVTVPEILKFTITHPPGKSREMKRFSLSYSNINIYLFYLSSSFIPKLC